MRADVGNIKINVQASQWDCIIGESVHVESIADVESKTIQARRHRCHEIIHRSKSVGGLVEQQIRTFDDIVHEMDAMFVVGRSRVEMSDALTIEFIHLGADILDEAIKVDIRM